MISVLTKNNGEHSEHVTVALMFNNTDAERTRDPSRNILTGSRTGISHHGSCTAHRSHTRLRFGAVRWHISRTSISDRGHAGC